MSERSEKRESRLHPRKGARDPSYRLPKSIPLSDATSWILFNKNISPFSRIYVQRSFLFLRFFPSWRKLARIRNSSRWWGCGGVFYGFVGWTPRLILPLSSAGLLLLFGRGAARLEMETRRNEFLPFFIEHHESLERGKREQCPLLVCNVN